MNLTPDDIASIISEDIHNDNGILLEAGELGPGQRKVKKVSPPINLEPVIYKGQVFHAGGSVPVPAEKGGEEISGEIDQSGRVIGDKPRPHWRPLFSLSDKNKYDLVGHMYDDGRVELTGVSKDYEPRKSSSPSKGGGAFKALKITVTAPDGTREIRYCKPEHLERMEKYATVKRNTGFEVRLTKLSGLPQIENPEVRARNKENGIPNTIPLDCKPHAG